MILKRISVYGLGRVGLTMAVCLANKGNTVIGVDSDRNRLRKVSNGEAPFAEPGLDRHLRKVVRNGALSTSSDPLSSAGSDFVFITVGTPSNRDGSINLRQVKNAARAIGTALCDKRDYQLVVIKSTVTPGTARRIVRPILERCSLKRMGKHFGLCSNPEFLREGRAIHDTEFPDKIVIGSEDSEAIDALTRFYIEFHGRNLPAVIRTTNENAEMIKYANNAFLATKVSFINCIANITECVPFADVKAIAAGIGLDRRIGAQFLNAGLGWGGSCLPKDLHALLTMSRRLGYRPRIIEAVEKTNRDQWRRAIELAKQSLGSLAGRRVSILGMSFKPDTDDMRQAVSTKIVRSLLAEGASVVVYDPSAMGNARTIFGDRIAYADSSLSCIEQADCCIVVTEWDEFRLLHPRKFLQKMRRPFVIDGRRVFDADAFARAGIMFSAIGLGPRLEGVS